MKEIVMQTSVPEERVPERSLRDLYYVLFRHRRKTLLFFAAVVVTVTVGTFLVTETYRSEAKLLVRLGRESVSLDPTATTGQIVNVGQSRENEINSEMEILKSRELAEKVVDLFGASVILHGPEEGPVANASAAAVQEKSSRDDAGATDSPREREKAILHLMKSLEVEKEKNSNVLSLAYETSSPKLARDVVDRLIGLFQDKHIQAHRTTGSHKFFSDQTAEIRISLTHAENELRNLKNEAGVTSLEDERKVLVNRIGGLQQEIEQTEAAMAASGARTKALKKSLAKLPKVQVTEKTTGYTNYAADGMRQRLYDLQLREQDLLSRYKPESPKVMEVRRQIAEAQAVLNREEATRTQTTSGLNAAHEKIELDLMIEQGVFSSLQAKAGALRSQLAAAGEDLKRLNDTEIRIKDLQREVEVQNENYRNYVGKLEQARIDQALETDKISNISVVQPATYPVKPIRPRKLVNLALGLLMGLFGGLGLAFASEYTDHTLKKPEDIEERLQLSALAAVPLLSPDRISPAPKSESDTWSIPKEARDALELLRDRLPLPANDSSMPPVTLAVTSCREGEGVSFIASCLAEVLASHVDGRILLVAANLRHPSVLRAYGTNGSKVKIHPAEYAAQKDSPGKKVILADPSEESRKLLARFLREKGIEVIEAPDGNKALVGSVLHRPDFLLLDLSIDVIGAERVAAMLRVNSKTDSIPVIYMGEDEDAVSGFCRDIDRFFRKPVPPEAVLQKILGNQVHDELEEAFTTGNGKQKDTDDAFLVRKEQEIIPPLGDPKVSADLMKRWTGAYKMVVFDMPPVWDPGFSARLASQVNGVILVVEAEKVRWEVARQAKEFLGQTNANIFGAVLNKRQFHIPEWMYRRL
jgi:uncharacterized protein involved in exopolysaccharide biosynthesis/Mrp family chromosome partitioning ATPase